MNVLVRPLVQAWYALRHPFAHRRYRSLVVERVGEVPFLVLPQVFNPALLRTGELLAAALESMTGDLEGARVLDMGTGSGVGAVFAARRGARVVAVDINPDAVRCAKINALLNGVEDRIDVRHGDLMGPLAPEAGERFDLVLFNPPFYRGRPQEKIDYAWRGEDVLERFAAGLAGVLTENGRVLVVFSERGEWRDFRALLERQGFEICRLERRREVEEVYLAALLEPRRAERLEPIAGGRTAEGAV